MKLPAHELCLIYRLGARVIHRNANTSFPHNQLNWGVFQTLLESIQQPAHQILRVTLQGFPPPEFRFAILKRERAGRNLFPDSRVAGGVKCSGCKCLKSGKKRLVTDPIWVRFASYGSRSFRVTEK